MRDRHHPLPTEWDVKTIQNMGINRFLYIEEQPTIMRFSWSDWNHLLPEGKYWARLYTFVIPIEQCHIDALKVIYDLTEANIEDYM